ncbi:MAG TPA: hypothetical protein VGM62_01600 [Chthoniobacterales bacterium]|jgi:hypothetical protein
MNALYSNKRIFCSVALLVGFLAGSTCANTLLTNSGTGGAGFTMENITVGYDFAVGASPLEITALGLWDNNLNGFSDAHFIGLWDNSGTLLAKATVLPGTVNPLVGEFRYATVIPIGLGPVILSAGTTYVIGAQFIENDADFFKGNDSLNQAASDPAITLGNLRSGIGFTFPNQSFGPGSLVGPNAQFNGAGVPESGPGLLMTTSILAALFSLHYRHRAWVSSTRPDNH